MMITPPKLNPGDKIGIVAPARKIEFDELNTAIDVFESWGLKVELGKNLFKEDHQFAGTDLQRAEDFQCMLDNPEIKAIFCARGGYGTIKILPLLSFKTFLKSPKWIVGFSDITALHAYLNNKIEVKSIHGIMPFNIKPENKDSAAVQSLKSALFNGLSQNLCENQSLNLQGEASGVLVGGNLSVLYSISGTRFDFDYKDKILVLEDLDEYLYHIDRMMMNLKYSDKLSKLKGLVVGGMTDMHDNKVAFGKTAYEIIFDAVKEYNYPVCFNFPVGHQNINLSLILGSRVNLVVNESETTLTYLND
jgi:muramoyltetrapeptide carboxypeptidase